MSEITILEEARLSKLSDDELLVEAIERASKHILSQTLIIKDLAVRLSSLENIVHDLDSELEDYR
tara:strand:- start:2824 stop:3018 length:195 start_codon:yes stop_codon:yes gene_type:complete